jgi:hypothetical protein
MFDLCEFFGEQCPSAKACAIASKGICLRGRYRTPAMMVWSELNDKEAHATAKVP